MLPGWKVQNLDKIDILFTGSDKETRLLISNVQPNISIILASLSYLYIYYTFFFIEQVVLTIWKT